MINEKELAEKLQTKKIYPEEAVELRLQLSGLYSFYSQNLEDILLLKPQKWAGLRENTKSDKQADQQWDATEMGKNERGLSMRLKRIAVMMSALKSVIDNAKVDYNYTK